MSRSRASDVDACPVSASLLGEQRQRLSRLKSPERSDFAPMLEGVPVDSMR